MENGGHTLCCKVEESRYVLVSCEGWRAYIQD